MNRGYCLLWAQFDRPNYAGRPSMGWWPKVERRQGRRFHGHEPWRQPISGDPRWWGGSGTTARVTQQGGGPIWGQRGRGVLISEPIRGGVGRRRGTTAVEVDRRAWEPARWAVRSTERSRSSWRRGRGWRMAGVAHPRGGTHGHSDGFRNSPQHRCFVDASEPACAWGRGGARGAAGPGVRGVVAWHASVGGKQSRGTLDRSSSAREMRGATRISELCFVRQVSEVIRAATSVGAHGRQVAGGRQRRRELAGGDRATVVSPCTRGQALAGTHGHGPSWATGKRALLLIFFLKIQNQHKSCNSIW
jgi:hypothetical protein